MRKQLLNGVSTKGKGKGKDKDKGPEESRKFKISEWSTGIAPSILYTIYSADDLSYFVKGGPSLKWHNLSFKEVEDKEEKSKKKDEKKDKEDKADYISIDLGLGAGLRCILSPCHTARGP